MAIVIQFSLIIYSVSPGMVTVTMPIFWTDFSLEHIEHLVDNIDKEHGQNGQQGQWKENTWWQTGISETRQAATKASVVI
jgi:hypothetical protein